ncbi:transcriptional regulator with XRE-family HTH domain [Nakamurella sp. UYEF19]|uniref:helix-turn-helix transcriptional regulator n=1 Tax=Nakamurella sp. UYEF19 TaxID=1756392 RepID=UPI003390C50B
MDAALNPIARRELAALLRTRREAINPADVGLPPRMSPTRTPGLRREEVAALAGVSVDYLIRLEQARDVRPSAQVAQALAGALRLDEHQTGYLFTLAGHRAPERSSAPRVPDGLRRMVADFAPTPAMVLNHRLDILAWNEPIAGLLLDFDRHPVRERNIMRMCFLDPRFRDFYPDTDVIRGAVADLRAAWATHAADQQLALLLAELERDSDAFATHWRSREVAVRASGVKAMNHPAVGELSVTFEVLAPLGDPDLRLIVYRAADEHSERALARINRIRADDRGRVLRVL